MMDCKNASNTKLQNIVLVRYEDYPVKALKRTEPWSLWESGETHNYKMRQNAEFVNVAAGGIYSLARTGNEEKYLNDWPLRPAQALNSRLKSPTLLQE